MRYISHEIRNPINTVHVGLQLVADNMRNSNFNLRENLDIVEDCHNGCKLAVDILTDILSYDKLESGDMKLNRSLVSILSLLDQAHKQFTLQV